MSGRRRVTPEAQARADRIAAALSGLLEDEPPEPDEPQIHGDPFRPVPRPPTRGRERRAFPCPGCAGGMFAHYSRGVAVYRCEECSGLWLDPGEIEEMVPEPEVTRVEVSTIRQRMRAVAVPSQTVHYRDCPRCEVPMNRRNFGGHSGVIVDECAAGHGLFLDPGEFEAIETFISFGGLELQRQRLAERNEQKRNAKRAQRATKARLAAVLSTHWGRASRERSWWDVFF